MITQVGLLLVHLARSYWCTSNFHNVWCDKELLDTKTLLCGMVYLENDLVSDLMNIWRGRTFHLPFELKNKGSQKQVIIKK